MVGEEKEEEIFKEKKKPLGDLGFDSGRRQLGGKKRD